MARPPDPMAKISLLQAAVEVFAEHGLAAAKVEEITRRAGHSKGAFYLHFDSKEDAFKEVLEAFLARLLTLFQPPSAFPNLPDDPKEIVQFWLDRDIQLFDFLWQNRAIVGILAGCQGPTTYLLETFLQAVQKTSAEWLRHSAARGLLREDLDVELASTVMCGAYHELSNKMLAVPRRPPLEEWLRQTMEIFLRGIGSPRLVAALGAPREATARGRARTPRAASRRRTTGARS